MAVPYIPRAMLFAIVGIALILIVVAFGLWQYENAQLAQLQAETASMHALAAPERLEQLKLQKDLLQIEFSGRIGIAQFIGSLAQGISGLVLLAGLWFTWRSLQVSSQNLHLTQREQTLGRFTHAIDQLGSRRADGAPNIEIRMGAIYALWRIAKTSMSDPSDHSKEDYKSVMDILASYVRENAALKRSRGGARATMQALRGAIEGRMSGVAGTQQDEARPARSKMRTDIQTILTILGERECSYGSADGQSYDLSETDLSGANLSGAHLEQVNLMGAHLRGAEMVNACLKGATLVNARLEGASLEGAKLQHANLNGAYLDARTSLEGACLTDAALDGAHIDDVSFSGIVGAWPERIRDARPISESPS